MVNEMIERVANALHEDRKTNKLWNDESQAKAAIATMREPTEEMLGVASRECSSVDNWKAMIDAALKE